MKWDRQKVPMPGLRRGNEPPPEALHSISRHSSPSFFGHYPGKEKEDAFHDYVVLDFGYER
jgi:hypothetical protein